MIMIFMNELCYSLKRISILNILSMIIILMKQNSKNKRESNRFCLFSNTLQ